MRYVFPFPVESPRPLSGNLPMAINTEYYLSTLCYLCDFTTSGATCVRTEIFQSFVIGTAAALVQQLYQDYVNASAICSYRPVYFGEPSSTQTSVNGLKTRALFMVVIFDDYGDRFFSNVRQCKSSSHLITGFIISHIFSRNHSIHTTYIN